MTPRDLDTPPPERIFLDGPIGRLSATLEVPSGEPKGALLLLHPHPQHGGSRKNNVVRWGALGALEAGWAALRVDFRGVGDSEGEYDKGDGEVHDAECAFAWLGNRFPGTPRAIWGFSFGSVVGLELADRVGKSCAQYMAIAWPTQFYSWPSITQWPQRMKVLAGNKDEFVDISKMKPIQEQGAEIQILEGANHFFHGMLPAVRTATAKFLGQ
ncbi:MAG: alpha/beta hydrolase [Planctomycetota bacterium]|jgi:hypothetical protein|nr:alpha/beta hydrolase [Planctomycetota bacterium]